MRIILFIVVVVAVFLGAMYMFNDWQNMNKIECNGSIIGKEESGQMRNIYKCSDGNIKIF